MGRETRNVYRILVGTQVGKKTRQERPKKEGAEQICKIDCEDGIWIELAHNCVQLGTYEVNMLKLGVFVPIFVAECKGNHKGVQSLYQIVT